MLHSHITNALIWAISFASASASFPRSDPKIIARNFPRRSSSDTIRALGLALTDAAFTRRDNVFKNSTIIEKYWADATLFSYESTVARGNATATASIDVICTTCYVRTKAAVQLTVDENFNATAAFKNVTNQITQQFENVTTTLVNYVDNYIENTVTSLADGIDASDFALPPIDVDFHIDLPEVPETHLSFQFDDMELYVMLDTILSGGLTYNLNLYTSNTPIGVSISNEVQAGVIFSIDLVLSAEADIDISSGFHIKLDDGVAFDIALFSQNVSGTTFNGGSFEFLPVSIQGVGAVIAAVLRVGIQAGFDLNPPSSSIFDVSAGVMVGVFAHIAEFTTNVTATPADENNGCALRVQESYQLAIGAVAGATVALDDHTWGPVPATTVPVYYTTLADVCGSSKTATANKTTSINAREDLTTTTLKTTETYTAVQCLSTGLINCPISLQTTAITSSVKSLITSVASGVTATWPPSVLSSVSTTIPFGSAAKDLFATSGTPTSYTPAPSSISDDLSNLVNGVDKRIIIGVSVGVGGALILAIAGCCFFRHRRRRSATSPMEAQPMISTTPVQYQTGHEEWKKRSVKINVSQH